MSFYGDRIFPFINDAITQSFHRHRARLLGTASGEVLEIGFGSGLSLKNYPKEVARIVGLEPNAGMRAKAQERIVAIMESGAHGPASIELVDGRAERIPFPDQSFDGVVSFLTLCSVTGLEEAASEILRVLNPGGTLFFLEHTVQPSKGANRVIQLALAPYWRRVACGCHLDRDALAELRAKGFEVRIQKTIGYQGFPNFLSPVYRGVAIKRS
jgi:ubiquinone/menaquinone biosynthesis C-methylase UbiE